MGFLLIYKNRVHKTHDQKDSGLGGETLLSITREVPGVAFGLFGTTLVIVQYQAALVIFVELSAIVAGLGFAFMGFLLFDKGLFKESEVEAVWGDKKLFLKRAAPGTVFALFGVFVIVYALYKVPTLEFINNAAPVTKDMLKDANTKVGVILVQNNTYHTSNTTQQISTEPQRNAGD
jgi:hypothetical protein